MSRKYWFVAFLILLYIVPFCLALDTTFNIKTLSNHKISVVVREAGKLVSLESFLKDTGTGDVSVKFSSSKTSLDVIMTVMKDGVKVVNEKFEGIAAGNPINILLYPGNTKILESTTEKKNESQNTTNTTTTSTAPVPANITQETAASGIPEVNNTQQTQEATKEKGLTGSVISDSSKKQFNFKILYYILGVIVFLSAIVFVVMITSRKAKEKKEGEPYGNFKIKPGKNDNIISKREYDPKIHQIERKIEEAKKELDEIRNRKTRIEEARRKFEDSKKELEKLEKSF
jgi:hypothetical protein